MKNNVSVIIVDNTNTTKQEAEPYLKMAEKYGYDVQVISVSVSESLNEKQLQNRVENKIIPSDVVKRQKARIEPLL
jgi:predicted kinase